MSYLTPTENLYSFFDIDDKLHCNHLLREQRYSIDLCNLTTFVSSTIFRYLCLNVLSHISQYVQSLKINADFVGSPLVHELPCMIYSNLDSLYLHSLQEEDLGFVLKHAIQLKHLTLENVTSKSINMVFEQYLYRLESFCCNDVLPADLSIKTSFSILSTFSVRLSRSSHLFSFVIHMPQLKNLKLNFCDWYKTDEDERLNLLQMIKSDAMKALTNMKQFTFISLINKIPWSIFVRLVQSMVELHTLSFDFGVTWVASPDDIHRYDESWKSISAACYLATALQSLQKLVNLSFRVIIFGCNERPVESRWNSPYWPRTNWCFDFEPPRRFCYFYTVPWPAHFKYFLEFPNQVDQLKSDPYVKMAYFATNNNVSNVNRFARLSQHFPKIRHLTMMDSGTISLSSPRHCIPQTLIYCWSLKTCPSISGEDLKQILAFLPRLRRLTIDGGLDQLTAFANCQTSSVIQLNVFEWTATSIDLLTKDRFPSIQFLSINLDHESIADEVSFVHRTIEKSFENISTLMHLHYSNTMTNEDFILSINSDRYLHFYNVHIEKIRIIVWK